jgi:DNA segregation ATPase FtsK/SpoIIIE-like protein
LSDKIEKNSNIQKDLKQKITNKRIRIKIEIQNKFYIWLKGEIEKKNKFSKRIKRSKEWGLKLT